MEGTAELSKNLKNERSWRDFRSGHWCSSIDVRDFIVCNVTPYDGDETFLAGASKRTMAVRDKLQPYFQEERKKGVLAVDAKTPSTLLAHKAGYIDRDNEVVVGLQTDQPFKRAIFPLWRVAHGRGRAPGSRNRSRPAGSRGLHEIPKDP
jgi:formate C-acetyltransferase